MKYILLFYLLSYGIQECLLQEYDGTHGYNDTIIPKAEGTAGVPMGGLMIQRITPVKHESNGLVYTDTLKYVDPTHQLVYKWNYTTGKEAMSDLKEIGKEYIAFYFPTVLSATKLVGSANKIRVLTYFGGHQYVLSKPVIELGMGHVIQRAHTDKNGVLFFVTDSLTDIGSSLYKIKDRKAVLVQKYPHTVQDFAFSVDHKKMYAVCSTKHVYEHDYSLNNATIAKAYKLVFSLPRKDVFAHIVAVDTDSKNYLWMGINHGDAMVVQYSMQKKTPLRVMRMPATKLTSLTFGGYQSKNVFIGTKSCNKNKFGGGSVYAITGLDAGGQYDYAVNW